MKKLILTASALALMIVGCQNQNSAPIQAPSGGGSAGAPSAAIGKGNEIQILQGIVRQDPKNLNAYIQLGNIFMDTKRFPEAIENYTKALELDPNNVNVRIDLGTCYRSNGRPDRALEEYTKGLKVDPNHPYGNRNTGVVLAYDLNRPIDALPYFEKFLQVAPGDVSAPAVQADVDKIKSMTQGQQPGK